MRFHPCNIFILCFLLSFLIPENLQSSLHIVPPLCYKNFLCKTVKYQFFWLILITIGFAFLNWIITFLASIQKLFHRTFLSEKYSINDIMKPRNALPNNANEISYPIFYIITLKKQSSKRH